MAIHPLTFHSTPPKVGISAWHRRWLKGHRAGLTEVPCGDCVVCCSAFEYISLNPHVDDVSQYQTRRLDTGETVLAQHADGSCFYLVDNRCSIYERRPDICRAFDCRMFSLLPYDDAGMDKLFGAATRQSPQRICAERLRDTANEKFALVEKEPDDRTFDERFWTIFLPMLQRHAIGGDMASILAATLVVMGRAAIDAPRSCGSFR